MNLSITAGTSHQINDKCLQFVYSYWNVVRLWTS